MKHEISLIGFFFLAINALLISGLVRYGNDTAYWDIPYRSLASALASQGDLPLWYPGAGNGFPHLSLQWASWVANPLGIAISLLRPYDYLSLALENVIWRAAGFAGAFAFARQWTASPVGAAAIAATYVGSGTMSWAALSYSALIGQMFAPWVLAAGSLAIRAPDAAHLLRAIGTLGLAYGAMVWCAYPGAWLAAPVLGGPVLLGLALAHRNGHVRLGAAAVCGGALAILIISLIISESTSLTLIEGSIIYSRRNPALREGLLRGIDLASAFLADPSYLPTVSSPTMHPLYSGVLPLIVLVGSFGVRRRPPVNAVIVLSAALALVLANTQNWNLLDHPLFRELPAFEQASIISDHLVLTVLFLVPMLVVGMAWGRPLPLDAVDKVLLLGIAWVLLVSGDNPAADFLRFNVPPFVLVRYNHLYFWLVTLLVATFAWRRIELFTGSPTTSDQVPPSVRAWGRTLSAVGLASLVVSALIGLATRDAHGLGAPADGISAIGSPHLAWQGAILTLGLLTGAVALWVTLRPTAVGESRVWTTLVVTSAVAFTTACVAGALFRRAGFTPPTIPISFSWQLVLDLAHGAIIVAASAVAFAKAPTQSALRAAIAAIMVFDVSLAVPRNFSDNDTMGASQPGWPFPPFQQGHGGDQFLPRTTGLHKGDFARPFSSSFSPPPAVSRLKAEWGELYERWVHFPATWTFGTGGDVSVTRDSVAAASGPSGCPAAARVPDAVAAGGVNRLLATTVDVSFTADCDRLLVFTDSWAPGWCATIDGSPAPVLRVNDAIRGVMVPAGTHALVWRYRPRFLVPLQAMLLVGLGVSGALVAAPWWFRRLPIRVPERVRQFLGIEQYSIMPGASIVQPAPIDAAAAKPDGGPPVRWQPEWKVVPALAIIGVLFVFSVANYDPRIDGPAEPFRLFLVRSLLAGTWAWIVIAGGLGFRSAVGPMILMLVVIVPPTLQVARRLYPVVDGTPVWSTVVGSASNASFADWKVSGQVRLETVDREGAIVLRTDGSPGGSIARDIPPLSRDFWPWWQRPLGALGSSVDVSWSAAIDRTGPYYTILTIGWLKIQAVRDGLLFTAPASDGDVRADFVPATLSVADPVRFALSIDPDGSSLSIDGRGAWKGGNPNKVEQVILGDASPDREHGGTMTVSTASVTRRLRLGAS